MTHHALLAIGNKSRTFLEDLQTKFLNWNPNLCGACGVGAYINWKLFSQYGFQASMVMADNMYQTHCWTEVRVNRSIFVVDTTATQYGKYPGALILPLTSYRALPFVQPNWAYYRDRSAVLGFTKIDWPEYQTPKFYNREIKRFLKSAEPPSVLGFKAA